MNMKLLCENGEKYINIGRFDLWKALYSTVVGCLGNKEEQYQLAFEFLKSGCCKGEQGYEVARQINRLRDELSQFPPDKAVYDIDNPELMAPWKDNMSPVITSCANMFITADGQDLLYEIVCLLCYAQIAETDIIPG